MARSLSKSLGGDAGMLYDEINEDDDDEPAEVKVVQNYFQFIK